MRYEFLIDSILRDCDYDANDITTMSYSMGGLADLSGNEVWDTPRGRKQKRYYEYYMIVLDDEEDNVSKTVVFVKCPPTMDGNLKIDKMQDFLRNELNYHSSAYSESLISPRLIRLIDDNMTTYGRVCDVTGADPDDLVIIEKIPTKVEREKEKSSIPNKKISSRESSFVENQMQEIKDRARALAREKYDILISNGVEEHLARKAANDAYMKMVIRFQKEKGDFLSDAPRKNVENPLHRGNVREIINQANDRKAKEMAVKKYTELKRLGKSDDYAKMMANKLYKKLKGLN